MAQTQVSLTQLERAQKNQRIERHKAQRIQKKEPERLAASQKNVVQQLADVQGSISKHAKAIKSLEDDLKHLEKQQTDKTTKQCCGGTIASPLL